MSLHDDTGLTWAATTPERKLIMAMIPEHSRVATEYGHGRVTHSSSRRIVVALDDGQTINVVTGTPGYDRIVALTELAELAQS